MLLSISRARLRSQLSFTIFFILGLGCLNSCDPAVTPSVDITSPVSLPLGFHDVDALDLPKRYRKTLQYLSRTAYLIEVVNSKTKSVQWTGSGVLLHPGNILLSAYHVLPEADSKASTQSSKDYRIRISRGGTVFSETATVLDTSPRKDLALLELPLKLEGSRAHLNILNEIPSEGAVVALIGYPEGVSTPRISLGRTFGSAGMGSADQSLVSASSRHGMSGGPVFLLGENGDTVGLLGVVTRMASNTSVYELDTSDGTTLRETELQVQSPYVQSLDYANMRLVHSALQNKREEQQNNDLSSLRSNPFEEQALSILKTTALGNSESLLTGQLDDAVDTIQKVIRMLETNKSLPTSDIESLGEELDTVATQLRTLIKSSMQLPPLLDIPTFSSSVKLARAFSSRERALVVLREWKNELEKTKQEIPQLYKNFHTKVKRFERICGLHASTSSLKAIPPSFLEKTELWNEYLFFTTTVVANAYPFVGNPAPKSP